MSFWDFFCKGKGKVSFIIMLYPSLLSKLKLVALKQNQSFHNPKGKGNIAENWLLQELKDQEKEEDAMKPQAL